MQKSLAFVAVLLSAGSIANAASAATVKQCQSRLQTCIKICLDKGVKQTADGSPCTNRCYNVFTGCMQPVKAGKFQVQRGPNAVITTPKSTRGSTPIQTGPNAVVTTSPVRPTMPGGNPCTVHCGPLGGKKR
jgi:hypothetical protein